MARVKGGGDTHGKPDGGQVSAKSDAHRMAPRSVNPIKSKIRDLRRLLDHNDDLPADVRLEKERALAGYKHDLEAALHEKEKQKMISRYHMVRFFERQKATRNLKRLRRDLAATSNDSSLVRKVQAEIHPAEVDLNYTIYFPLMQKYVGLFSKDKPEKDSHTFPSKSVAKSVRNSIMWKTVEKSMEEGTLDLLREGKSTLGDRSSTASQSRPSANGKHVSLKVRKEEQRARQNPKSHLESEDAGSDGGFFET